MFDNIDPNNYSTFIYCMHYVKKEIKRLFYTEEHLSSTKLQLLDGSSKGHGTFL